MSSREMVGSIDRTGQRFGTLQVIRMVTRYPLRWLIRCDRCGSEWREPNETLQIGGLRCRNNACFKAQESQWRKNAGA